MPIFQLPLANGTASATCSVDPHETPVGAAATSLAKKIQALTSWSDGNAELFPTSVSPTTFRNTVIASVVPSGSGDT